MSTTSAETTELTGLGPHPIFDELIAEQPADGYVRRLFGLGHRHELPPLEPDAVIDPPGPVPGGDVFRAVVSSTPTGSINLRLRAS